MEPETSLVRTESRVELDSVASVHLDFTLVGFPCYSELNDTLWDGGNFERLLVFWVLLEEAAVLECGGQLCGSVSSYPRPLYQAGLGWPHGS